MKQFILTFILFTSTFAFSQQINDSLKISIETENTELLASVLKKQNYSINQCFQLKEKPYSLFCIAVKLEKEKIFNYLIDQKADVNKICEDKSPLMYAVKYGNLKFTKKLVEAGAKISLENEEGKTAIDYAKKYDQKEIVEYLESKK